VASALPGSDGATTLAFEAKIHYHHHGFLFAGSDFYCDRGAVNYLHDAMTGIRLGAHQRLTGRLAHEEPLPRILIIACRNAKKLLFVIGNGRRIQNKKTIQNPLCVRVFPP
jgi:hypothetical protein